MGKISDLSTEKLAKLSTDIDLFRDRLYEFEVEDGLVISTDELDAVQRAAEEELKKRK